MEAAVAALPDGYIKEIKRASAVRVGDIIMIDGRACKVITIAVSKTGKHGHAKVRMWFADGVDPTTVRADAELDALVHSSGK